MLDFVIRNRYLQAEPYLRGDSDFGRAVSPPAQVWTQGESRGAMAPPDIPRILGTSLTTLLKKVLLDVGT